MNQPSRPGSTVRAPVITVTGGERTRHDDLLTTEEPLEIRVRADGAAHSLAVTMRTPGHDFELAAGFLFTEGVLASREAIDQIRYCTDPQNYNIVTVDLRPGTPFDPRRFTRNVYTTSSCGICGKTALDMVRQALPEGTARTGRPATFDEKILLKLPTKLREAQTLFSRTGGLHAAALFSPAGELLLLREDVGRHNAMDKVVGALLLGGKRPAADTILLVSGRASFELVQKAVMAGIPVFASVSAPSHLAVELAREFGLTLIGFLRAGRYNLYTGVG